MLKNSYKGFRNKNSFDWTSFLIKDTRLSEDIAKSAFSGADKEVFVDQNYQMETGNNCRIGNLCDKDERVDLQKAGGQLPKPKRGFTSSGHKYT